MTTLIKIQLVCVSDGVDEFGNSRCYINRLYYTYLIGNTFISVFEDRVMRNKDIPTDHYVGYFNTKHFITLAEYRQKQIEDILDGEVFMY